MAKPFLYSVAETYVNQLKSDLHKVHFVFPNRRAGVFFKKYIGQITRTPLILPKISTISDFVHGLSELEKGDNLDLLFRLFHVYNRHTGGQEVFDEFYFWGNVMLNDFDEIDKFYVDAQKLYRNMVDLKEIDATFSGLEKEQEEALRSFWLNFQEKKQPELKEQFLKNWSILYPVYRDFNAELLAHKIGYEGLVYRKVVDNLPRLLENLSDKTIVFAGFNALNRCEEALFDFLRNTGKAEFCWDYSPSPFMNDGNQAVDFMKKYTRRYPQKDTLKLDFEPQVEFRSIRVPSVTGQAYLGQSLLANQAQQSPDELTKSVMILCDESLLVHSLYSLPEQLSSINITMGYPVKASITLSLLNGLLKLQRHKRQAKGGTAFYSQTVQDVLQHEWIKQLDEAKQGPGILKQIVDQNLVYWTLPEEAHSPFTQLLFAPDVSSAGFTDWIIQLFEMVLDYQVPDSEEDEETPAPQDALAMLEKEILFFCITVLNRLSVQIKGFQTEIDLDILARIIKKAVENQTIPFEGEPLSGFQIMGVLESRTIDFEDITFLSFNEHVFPRKSPDNTFIPYNLRKGYGLTTTEYYDAMYAYYFYRLLQRAKRVTMIYNTSQSGIYPGEPSRYLLQLKYIYEARIKEQSVAVDMQAKTDHPIHIQEKAGEHLLQKYVLSEEKFLSASALNTYIDCTLKFYFTYIQGLREDDEVEEEIDQRVFGSIFHDAMEKLYEPYENNKITTELLQGLMRSPKVDSHLKAAMAHHFFKTTPNKADIAGQFRIIYNVLKKYIKKTLETDQGFAPFVYVKGEEKVVIPKKIGKDTEVFLGGFIDRVDQVDNYTRIIDYKTGTATPSEMSFSDVEQLFTPHKNRPKYVFQTMFYMVLYKHIHPNKITKPGIYFLRNLYKDFSWNVTQKKEKQDLDSNSPYLEEFEEMLEELLATLFSGKAEFKQTDIVEHCQYCAFKNICMR